MRFNSDRYKEITWSGAARTRCALVGNADEFSVGNACGNVYAYRLLRSIRAAKHKRLRGAAVGFFERNSNLCFQVTPASCKSGSSSAGSSTSTSKHALEEVAETTEVF